MVVQQEHFDFPPMEKTVSILLGLLFASSVKLFADTILNPSGIIVSSTATYWISVHPTNFPDEWIEWTAVPSSRVSFPQGNTGRVVNVQGEQAGDVILKPHLTGFPDFTPSLQARVVTPSTVNVHVYIVCSTNGHAAETSAGVAALLGGANDIWRQAGLSFQLASCNYITNDTWLTVAYTNGTWPLSNTIKSYASGTGGVECYFVDEIETANALTSSSGILFSTNGNFRTLAHEIGHACGLKDIYVRHRGTSLSVIGESSSVRLGVEWGSETTNGYYPRRTMQADEIQKLLMYGVGNGFKADIPYGDVQGLWYSNRWDSTNQVMQRDWQISPVPVGFFLHGNPNPTSN